MSKVDIFMDVIFSRLKCRLLIMHSHVYSMTPDSGINHAGPIFIVFFDGYPCNVLVWQVSEVSGLRSP